MSLLRFFGNPLVLILLAASVISIVLGDHVGGTIIITIVLLSVVVNFYVEFQARHAVEDIRKQVATTAAVLRDGHEVEVPVAGESVRGDIVHLNAGDLTPADARLLEAKDLHVRDPRRRSDVAGGQSGGGLAGRATQHGRRQQQRVPGDRGADRHRHGGDRPDGQGHGLRRDCGAVGDAAAGDGIRPRIRTSGCC